MSRKTGKRRQKHYMATENQRLDKINKQQQQINKKKRQQQQTSPEELYIKHATREIRKLEHFIFIHGFLEVFEQILPDKTWFHMLLRKQPKETVECGKIRELNNAFNQLTFYDFGCFKTGEVLLKYGDKKIDEAITVLDQNYNDSKGIIRDLLESNEFDEITEYKLSRFLTDMLAYIQLLKSFNENSAHIESKKSKP